MPESNDLFAEVANIRDEVEEQGAMLDALVRSGPLRESILEDLRKDAALTEVLVAVDGKRSQTEIVQLLKTQGSKGASGATVSRKLERLHHDFGLVVPSHRNAHGNVYRRSRLERALGIVRALKKSP